MAILKNTQVAENPVEVPTSKGGIKLRPVGIDIGIPEELGRTGYGDSQYDSEMSKDNLDYLNEIRAQRQTLLDKVGNGLGNFASTVLTSAAENTIGIAIGVSQAIFETDPSKLYNNDFAKQVLEPIQNWTKESLPFYYSEKEQNASVLGGMGYQNFWFDKALGGVGYTVGALASGYGLNKLLGVGKMATTGKLIENSADDVLKLASIESKVGSAVKLDITKQIYVGMSMAQGESSQEARDSYEQALQNGMSESEAEAIANKNYVTNLFITGATNFALLNKFIKPSYQQAVERNLVHSVEKKGEDGIVKSFLEDATLKDSKRYIKGRATKGLISAGEESSQEFGQFMSNKLWQRYEDLANDKNGKSAVDNFMTAFGDAATETFGSKEGLESALIGAITGAPFGMKGAKAEMLQKEENTAKYINALNEDPEFKNLMYYDATQKIKTRLDLGNIVRAKAFFDESEKALLEGDKFNYHNDQLNGLGQVVQIVADKGTFDVWRKSLLDLKSSDDIAAFNQRFGFTETEIKDTTEKNEKIDKILESVDAIYKQYNVTKEFFNMNKYDGISDPLLNNVVNQSLFNKLYFASINLNNIEKREKELAKELDKLGHFASEYNLLRTAANYNAERDEPLILQLINDKELPNTADTYEKYRKKLVDTYRETYNKKLEELQKEQPHIAPLITEKLADLNKLAEQRELFAKAYNQLISKEGREAEVQALNNANEIAQKQMEQTREKAKTEYEDNFGVISPTVEEQDPEVLAKLTEDNVDEINALHKEWQDTSSIKRLDEIINRLKELGLNTVTPEQIQDAKDKITVALKKQQESANNNNPNNKFIGIRNFSGIQPIPGKEQLISNAITLHGNKFKDNITLKVKVAEHGTPGKKTNLNEKLDNNYNTISVEVWVNGYEDGPIGYITNYDRYADKEGNVLDVGNMSDSKIKEFFNLPDGELESDFRLAYLRNKDFILYLTNELNNNKGKEFTINNTDFKRLISSLNVSMGQFDPIPLIQDKTPLTEFGNVILHINNEPLIIDRYGFSHDVDGNIVRFSQGDITSFGAIMNDDVTGEMLPMFLQNSNLMETLNTLNEEGKLTNRYVTLVGNPGGKIIVNGLKYDVLPLSPKKLVNGEEIYNELKAKSDEIIANLKNNINIDVNELDSFNNQINDKIFITNVQDSKLTIQLTSKGQYVLKYFKKGYPTLPLYINTEQVNSFEELTNGFGKMYAIELEDSKKDEQSIYKHLVQFAPVSINNFKQVIPDNSISTPGSEVIGEFETGYNVTYKKGQSVILNFNAPEVKASKVEPIVTPVSTTPPSNGFGTTIEQASGVNPDASTPVANLEISPEQQELNRLAGITEIKAPSTNNENISAKNATQTRDSIGWTDYSIAYNNLRTILGNNSVIDIAHLDKLATEIFDKNYLWGAFKDKTIYLATSTQKGTEYHEAFHGIFRTFLNDYEINNYLTIGKELLRNELKKSGISFEQHFTVFKNNPLNAKLVKELTDEELKDLVVEEFMADEFMKWKNNRENKSFLSKLFQSIIDLFNLFTGKHQTELDSFFRAIEGGKYINHTVTKNKYYRDSIQAKLIPNGTGTITPQRQMQMVNTIASYMLKDAELKEGDEWTEIFETALKVQAEQFNPNKFTNLSPAEQIHMLHEFYAHNGNNVNPIGKAILKEEVFKLLRIFNINENDIIEDLAETEAINRTFSNLNNENKAASFSGLSTEVKRYIALTTYTTTLRDLFKNKNLPDDVITVAVDPKKIYDGIVKNTADCLSDDEIINSMIGFMGSSEESRHFISKFFNDIGIVVDPETNEFTGGDKNPNIRQQIIKAFNLYTLDHRFAGVDLIEKRVKIHSANTQGMDMDQLNEWSREYREIYEDISKDKQIKTELVDNFKKINILLNPKQLTNAQLDAKVESLYKLFNNVSIKLSKGYIRYLLVAQETDTNLTKKQVQFRNTYYHRMKVDNKIAMAMITEIQRLIEAGHNPFEPSSKEKEEATDAISRLKKLAGDNALHDENVAVTNFKNAENNSVYQYQHGTFHVVRALQLRRESEKTLRDKINATDKLPDTPANTSIKVKNELNKYRLGSYLNSLPSFTKGVLPYLKIVRGEGMRVIKSKVNEEGISENTNVSKEEGVTFGNFSQRDLALYYYSMFADRSFRKVVGMTDVAVSPVIINIMEASSTLDMVELPVHNFYNYNGFDNTFKNVIFQAIEKEYSRIKAFNEGKLNMEMPGYTTPEKSNPPRASVFWKWNSLLATTLTGREIKDLESLVLKPEDLKDKINDAIVKYFENELDQHLEFLVQEKIINFAIGEDGEGHYYNRMLDSRFHGVNIVGENKLFADKDRLRVNIAKAYFSNYVNVMSYNQLQVGDPALHGKDDIDVFKRARKFNAGGSSLYSNEFQELKYGVFKDPKFKAYFNKGKVISQAEYDETNPDHSFENKDKADAQAYGNEVLARQILKSLGRFPKKVEDVFNKLTSGKELSFEERKLLKDTNAMLNSYKLVGVDEYGQFLKMSVVFIFEKDVTYKDKNGNVKPITKHLERYNIYKAMKDSSLHMFVPESGSKNISFGISHVNADGAYNVVPNSMDTNFFRLQMENPAGKIEGKDPSQTIGIIDTEQKEDQEVTIDGVKTTMGDVKKDYLKTRSDKSKALFHSHERFLFDIKNGVRSPRFDIWLDAVKDTIADSKGNFQLIEMIELLKEKTFNIPTHYAQFEKYYNAFFSDTLQHKIPQYKTTLVSDFGYNVIEYNGKVITDKTYKNNPEYWESLIASGKAVTRRLQHNILGKDGRRYSEFMLPAHFAEFYGLKVGDDIPDDIAYMFGIRIPTQDKHSGLALKLVDFLPAEQGSNAVFPEEIITLTGSDFDIDALYIHRPDHYVDGKGNIKLFGNSEDSDFDQYIRWNKEHNKILKKVVKYLTKLNPKVAEEINKLTRDIKTTNILFGKIDEDYNSNKPLSANEIRLKNLTDDIFDKAMTMLELPKTEKEYINFIKDNYELNIGKLNNKLLTQKIAFQNNEHVANNIANNPASLTLINDELDNLARLKGLANRHALDKSFDIFGFNAQSQAHASVSGGQAGIGIAVNNTQAFTWLNKYGITSEHIVNIDGKQYNSFENTVNEEELRIMDILSTEVSAMTDNGKHGYTFKGNLNMSTLTALSTLSMLGVNFRTGLYLINTPIIKDFSSQTAGNNIQTTEEKKLNKYFIYSNLLKKIPVSTSEISEEDLKKLITQDNLAWVIQNEANYNNLSNEDKNKYNNIQRATLKEFNDLDKIAKGVIALSGAIKFNKGLNITHVEQDNILNNLGKVFTAFHGVEEGFKKDLNTSTNLDHVNKILNNAAEIQLSRSSYFLDTQSVIKNNYKRWLTNKEFTDAKIEKDLMSYLTILAYRKNLKDNDIVYEPNELVYTDNLENQYYEFLKDEVFKTNAFVSILKPIAQDENGFSEIKTNTFSGKNKEFEERIINGFTALFNDPKYKSFATNLYLYLAAKDGFQFKSGTFINYIAPELFTRLANVANEAKELLKNNTVNSFSNEGMEAENNIFNELFDSSPTQVQKDFVSLWFRDINNSFEIENYNLPLDSKAVILSENKIVFDLFGGTNYSHKNGMISVSVNDTSELDDSLNTDTQKTTNTKAIGANHKQFRKLFRTFDKGQSYQFPLFFTRREDSSLEGEMKGSALVYYKLVSVNKEGTQMGINQGTKAEYVKTTPLGNRSKHNIMGSTLQEAESKENIFHFSKVKEKVKRKSTVDSDISNPPESFDPFEGLDDSNIPMASKNNLLADSITTEENKKPIISKEEEIKKGKELEKKCNDGFGGPPIDITD